MKAVRKSILFDGSPQQRQQQENQRSHSRGGSLDMEFYQSPSHETSLNFNNGSDSPILSGQQEPITPLFITTPNSFQQQQQQGFSSPTAQSPTYGDVTKQYEPVVDEVPLLEELGIDFKEIFYKTLFVLNPFSRERRKLLSAASNDLNENSTSSSAQKLLEEQDLAGPLLFCLALGMFLLLRGKVHFGYIYGVGTIGCFSIYMLLNLMCKRGVEIQRTISILGYSLLPMVFLALATVVFPLFLTSQSWGMIGLVMSWSVVAWSTWSATAMFVATLKMYNQKWLLAYPIGLVYAMFALITIF